ncbi:MAG: glycoside hydrolase family 125 protein [Oliverpabstia sp.]
MAVQGMTSKTRKEQEEILSTMVATTGGKGMMHEGFHMDNPEIYTRDWFSWANAMYCELFLNYMGYHIVI